jgi:hypothetical protein
VRATQTAERRRGTRASALGFASLWLAVAAQASVPLPVEYLQVEANEGGSSGGHVALRLGDSVFHYQQRAGLLQLLRDDVRDFLHAYALAGNRSVHALRLDVSVETAALLLARFEARQRAGERQLERLELLRADRRLLELASEIVGADAAPPGSSGALVVPAAGYFVAATPAGAPSRPSPRLAALRARVEARHGRDRLAARSAALHRQREALAPFTLPRAALTDVESEPPLFYSWSARHADLAGAETALELLRDAWPLRLDALVQAAPDRRLTPTERAALCAFREPLAEDLVDLAGGTRPDWGRAFLLGAARLLALEASCRRGELLVLDAFPEAADPEGSVPAPRPDVLALRLRDTLAALTSAREQLLDVGWDERRLSQLEALANQRAELERVMREGGPLRVLEERPVPRRSAPRLDLPPAPGSRDALATALQQARAREREFSSALAGLHAYHLVTQNCVTEIFRTLHAALGDSRDEIETRLGGYLDPTSRGHFIPFVSAQAVRARYRVAGERIIPSLRSARTARLAEREGRLAALRELSPWTSAGYARAATDSHFLFFSDGAPGLRPLLGVANLAAGAGGALLGLLWAPQDGGAQLVAGLRGIFWSLPELAFFSVRKGTNEYVPPEWIAALEAEVASADQALSTTTATVASVSGAPTRQ